MMIQVPTPRDEAERAEIQVVREALMLAFGTMPFQLDPATHRTVCSNVATPSRINAWLADRGMQWRVEPRSLDDWRLVRVAGVA